MRLLRGKDDSLHRLARALLPGLEEAVLERDLGVDMAR